MIEKRPDSSQPNAEADESLPADVVAALASQLTPIALPAERRVALRERVMHTVRDSTMTTIPSSGGEWKELTPLVHMKVLSAFDGAHSFLLRLAPGAVVPPHRHPADEECVVLEGEAWLGDIKVCAGDYHVARKGSRHGAVTSPKGALLFIRGADSDFSDMAIWSRGVRLYLIV